jgi:CBS-domain-containing membrane protein
MLVEQLMSRTPYTCQPSDMLDVPARVMWERDVGCVAVVDENRKAVGMITDRDICMAAYTTGGRLYEMNVMRTLNRPLVSCSPGDSIAAAERLMSEHQVRRLAVVDAFGALVGVISQNDLVREAVDENESRRREISGNEVLRTIHAIGSIRRMSLTAAAS